MILRQPIILLVMLLLTLALAGCGSDPVQYLQDNGELVNTKTSQFNPEDIAGVFRVPGSPGNIAEELARTEKPDFMSDPNPNRVLMMYPNMIIDITPDPANPESSLAEVASKEFVANNYSRDHFDSGDFLMGYVAAELMDEVFDVWKYKNKRGSVRNGGGFRGGGPVFGK